jgi:hypothetical protein
MPHCGESHREEDLGKLRQVPICYSVCKGDTRPLDHQPWVAAQSQNILSDF